MNRRSNGSREPLESREGIVLVDSKYFPSMVSKTASLVDRARPEENAILASVVSTLELQNFVSTNEFNNRRRKSIHFLR